MDGIEQSLPISDFNHHTILPSTLRIATGARVLLLSNLNTALGLVNGTTGVVTGITPANIQCAFYIPSIDGTTTWQHVRVQRVHIRFHMGDCKCTRTQFPLLLAYAITIHKAEGLTLNVALAHLERTRLSATYACPGAKMVRSLDNLFLYSLDPEVIKCDPDVLVEDARLLTVNVLSH